MRTGCRGGARLLRAAVACWSTEFDPRCQPTGAPSAPASRPSMWTQRRMQYAIYSTISTTLTVFQWNILYYMSQYKIYNVDVMCKVVERKYSTSKNKTIKRERVNRTRERSWRIRSKNSGNSAVELRSVTLRYWQSDWTTEPASSTSSVRTVNCPLGSMRNTSGTLRVGAVLGTCW